MKIEIIGTESLGVRGMCCYVQTDTRKVLIDPGVALGYRRYRLLPHPYQVACCERVKKTIINRWSKATDIVFSHFHGDHIPLPDANPYQLDLKKLIGLNKNIRFYAYDTSNISELEKRRADRLSDILNIEYINAEGRDFIDISFSEKVPHGDQANSVMMTRIKENKIFVHSSDSQLLDDRSISILLGWKPDILFADGPPVYLKEKISKENIEIAFKNTLRLSKKIPTIILDHHLLRCREGKIWLDSLSCKTSGKVVCGADFMHSPRRLLEARRQDLYKDIPVPKDWHKMYADAKTTTAFYWRSAKKVYGKA